MPAFSQTTRISVDAAALERWHYRPGAFQRLSPPWERMRVVEEPPEISDGSHAVIAVKVGPFWTNWIAEHRDCQPGVGFSDYQVKGPFAYWKHVHRFSEVGDAASELIDEITYGIPGGKVGSLLGGRLIRRKLRRTFNYRHAVTKLDLERLASEPVGDGKPMEILVTGATGMVGAVLEAFLRMRGHRVRRVTRNPSRRGDVRWDPDEGLLDLSEDERIDAVVHLAGENIAGGRWSATRKKRIMDSRRMGTRLLCEVLAARSQRPAVLVSASGANYYASDAGHLQDEQASRGSGFLSDVCEAWESETAVAEDAGIRVVRLRLGAILSPAGGVLGKMLPAFNLGIAGRLGDGGHRMPWIVLDDVIDIIHRALRDERYEGAINGVAPEIVTNSEFTSALAGVLRRPAIFPAPAFALRLALGRQMAEEILLADLAIEPARLRDLGYPFRYPKIEGALAYLLGKETTPIE